MKQHAKLAVHERQQHLQQWARRLAVDRLYDASRKDKGDGVRGVKPANAAVASTALLARRGQGSSSIFIAELSADSSGIGFAYGGVEPGRLRAHGKLFDFHKVHTAPIHWSRFKTRVDPPTRTLVYIALTSRLPASR